MQFLKVSTSFSVYRAKREVSLYFFHSLQVISWKGIVHVSGVILFDMFSIFTEVCTGKVIYSKLVF